jgi:hypothetical protein
MNNAADRLRDAAAGYGAFADPKQIDLVITLTLTVLEAVWPRCCHWAPRLFFRGGFYVDIGEVWRQKGDLGRALKAYAKAFRLRPDAFAYYQRGFVRLDRRALRSSML